MAVGPFDAIGAIASVGFQIAGGLKTYNADKKSNQYQQDMIKQEQAQEDVRRETMELMAGRMQIQNARNIQMAQAQARATATGQGAQFGSGLAGGLAQVSGQGSWNALGIQQNLELGEEMSRLTRNIDADKMGMAQAQSDALTGQALTSLGKGIGANMDKISAIGGDMFKMFAPGANMN